MNSTDVSINNKNDFQGLTLSQIVTKDYRTAAILERHGLDFCCKGNKSIDQACKGKDINPKELIKELNNVGKNNSNLPTGQTGMNFDSWELDFLTDFIINNHHGYIRSMGPTIYSHAEKVAIAHGKRHSETIEIANKFLVVYKDLKQHMMKEEEILFPYIKNIVHVKRNLGMWEKPYFGTIKNPVSMMEAEHQSAGDATHEIKDLTNNYTPPDDACNTFKVLYKELRKFEEDLHQHVHLENNILFPKSIILEEEVSKRITG